MSNVRRRWRRREAKRKTLGAAVMALLAATVAALAVYSIQMPQETGGAQGPVASIPSVEPTPPRLDTVFMGDSVTQANTPDFDMGSGDGSWVYWTTPDARSPWAELANVGVGGETTTSMLARFRKDVLSRKPEAVVILGGVNDAATGVPSSVTVSNLTRMVKLAESIDAKVWIVSPPPNDDHAETMAALAITEKGLAAKLEIPFVDINTTLDDHDSGRWPRRWTADGTHPTVAGARAISRQVLRQVA